MGVMQGRVRVPRKPAGSASAGEAPRIVHEALRSSGQPLDAATRAFMEPRFGAGVRGAPTPFPGPSPLAARLAVGAPHDRSEQEADAVANRVTRTPAPGSAPGRNLLAYELAHVLPQARPIAGGDGAHRSMVQRRSVAPAPAAEGRYDFGGVRVHADAQAAESARVMNADAFTVGQDVFFGAGQYSPHSASGQNLLAHELAHVVQQTGQAASGEEVQPSIVQHRLAGPCVQGKWRLDRIIPREGLEGSREREHGRAVSYPFGKGVYGSTLAWQEMGWVYMEVGGQAQVARWITMQYVFRNDGSDSDFLQLVASGQLFGNAKAEDKDHARAGAVVWGTIIERTAANPTPPERALFEPIEDGGISAATVGDLGVIEAEIPLGEKGSVSITIPLKKVEQGDAVAFSGSTQPVHDVPSAVDEVDVFLGARIEADAAIVSTLVGLPGDKNYSSAVASFDLDFESRPAPRQRAGATPAGPGTTTGPEVSAGKSATTATSEILHRAPDDEESVSRLARKAQEAEDDPRVGLHGVSAFTKPLDRPHSKAPREEVEKHFRVENTLGPTHRTIVLPKPVTKPIRDLFNRIFGRKKR
jgi:Domain of unknown function (DUF4157)